jgi:TetR/AcrR family tetracycline transcriptional repressor
VSRVGVAKTPRQAERATEIVEMALDIVRDDGVEQLTMRRLADAVGLKLPAIYRLFANKQALLDAMAESILAGALNVSGGDDLDWQQLVLELAQSLRGAILGQRDGARIIGGSYTAQQNTMTFADRLISAMEKAGLDGATALWSTTTVFCYVLGETLEQQSNSTSEVGQLRQQDIKAQFPHLFATPIGELINFDDRFAYGMKVIIRGLA